MTVTTIYEQDLHALNSLIPEATPDRIREITWLAPQFADEAGQLLGVIQAFVIQTPTHLIVVDTCVGDDKKRLSIKAWNDAHTGFMQRFRSAGFQEGLVDVVLCTHLHVDHVGWNTYWTGSAWSPTFPKARYLFAEVEVAHWRAERADPVPDPGQMTDPYAIALATFDLDQRQTHLDSILPVMEAGLADIVKGDHRICDGVSLLATPGHTPGHVSVRIHSDGEEAIITGDSVHHPCQIAYPEWATLVDGSPSVGAATRRELLKGLAASGGILLGSHFSEPVAGRVVSDGVGFRLVLDEQT